MSAPRVDDLGTRGAAQAWQLALVAAGLVGVLGVLLVGIGWSAWAWIEVPGANWASFRAWVGPASWAYFWHVLPYPFTHFVTNHLLPPSENTRRFFHWFGGHPVWLWVSFSVHALLVVGAGVGVYRSFRANQKRHEILTVGEPVIRDPQAAIKAFTSALKGADGVRIHPRFRIRKSDETEHILVVGATGSGKTQSMNWMIGDAIQRGDCMLIQDIKGDMSARFCAGRTPQETWKNGSILLAPWDARSARWHISADIQSRADAELVASIFVPRPKSGQQFFADESRAILATVMLKLRERNGEKWGWVDLWRVIENPRTLVKFLAGTSEASSIQLDPESGALSRQSHAVYRTLLSTLQPVRQLAEAWPNNRPGVAVQWLMRWQENRAWRVILGWRSDWSPTAGPLAAAFYSLFISRFLCAGEGHFKRPLWLAMDEFAALPRIEAIPDFLRLARSFGGRLVLGVQDVSSVRERYGRETADSILNSFGIRIVGRLEDSATAKWASESFGSIRVRERVISMQEGARGVNAGIADDGLSRSISWQEKDKAALVSSDLLHLPKATASGFYAWIKASGTSGQRLMGKIHYPIAKIEKPFPPCIPVGRAKPKPKPKPKPSEKPVAPAAPAAVQQEQQKVEQAAVEQQVAPKKQESAHEKRPEKAEQKVATVPQQPQPEPEPAQQAAQKPVEQEQAEQVEVDPVKEVVAEVVTDTAEAGLRQVGADQLADMLETADAARDAKLAVDVMRDAAQEQQPSAPAPKVQASAEDLALFGVDVDMEDDDEF